MNPMLRHSVFVSAIVVLIVCGACGAGGVRPTFHPFPEAITDTVVGEPATIVEQLSELLQDEGIELRWVRVREGYVETKWFDPVVGTTGGGRSLNTGGIVRLRFWTDLVSEHESVVVGEAVHRRVVDPSLPVRLTEAHVAPGHPGHQLLQLIFESLASGDHGHDF
jgi:hypothetical protein